MIPIYRLRFASESQYTAAMQASSLADDPRVVPVLVNVGRDDEGEASTMFHADLIVQGLPDLPQGLKQFAVKPVYPKHVFSGIDAWSDATQAALSTVITPTGAEDVSLSDEEAAVILDSADAWIQPTGGHDAYAEAAIVKHNGQVWYSLVPANVWEPGVSGWRLAWEPTSVVPRWIQPTGAHDAYSVGDKVTHDNQLWVSTLDANVWAPGVAGWESLTGEPEEPEEPEQPPEWVQPTGSHDAYNTGDLVTFEGQVYRSLIDGNVWSPTAYPAGWELV